MNKKRQKLPRGTVVYSLAPYRHQVIFAPTRKSFREIGSYLCGQPFDDGEDADGRMIDYKDDKGRIFAIGVYSKCPAILAHECSHVVFALFDTVGINAHDSNGEAFCYLLQGMMEKFMPFLKQ